jgi:hypothetical protein
MTLGRMGPGEMRRVILARLSTAGLMRSKHVATIETDELFWVVEPEFPPGSRSLSIDLGCLIKELVHGASEETPANYAHVYTDSGLLDLSPPPPPPGYERFDDYRTLSVILLDSETDVDDETRTRGIEGLVDPLANFVLSAQSLDDLRDLYSNGIFRGAAISKQARQLLTRPS